MTHSVSRGGCCRRLKSSETPSRSWTCRWLGKTAFWDWSEICANSRIRRAGQKHTAVHAGRQVSATKRNSVIPSKLNPRSGSLSSMALALRETTCLNGSLPHLGPQEMANALLRQATVHNMDNALRDLRRFQISSLLPPNIPLPGFQLEVRTYRCR